MNSEFKLNYSVLLKPHSKYLKSSYCSTPSFSTGSYKNKYLKCSKMLGSRWNHLLCKFSVHDHLTVITTLKPKYISTKNFASKAFKFTLPTHFQGWASRNRNESKFHNKISLFGAVGFDGISIQFRFDWDSVSWSGLIESQMEREWLFMAFSTRICINKKILALEKLLCCITYAAQNSYVML